jgi:Rrf2 family transcriptional regulator, iron-sulfur cluster assembly transcription factor
MMVAIARQGGKTPVTLSEVAFAAGLSLSYAEHLSAFLSRNGLIRGFRGPGGGYRLAKPVYDISILDILLSEQGGNDARRNKARYGALSAENPHVEDLLGQLEMLQYLLLQHMSLADVVSGDLSHHPLLKGLFKLLE